MNEGLFLTSEELRELTGFRAAHCQVRWLERNRWRFALNRRNEPRVARQYFQERMGCAGGRATFADAINHAAAAAVPNFTALDRR